MLRAVLALAHGQQLISPGVDLLARPVAHEAGLPVARNRSIERVTVVVGHDDAPPRARVQPETFGRDIAPHQPFVMMASEGEFGVGPTRFHTPHYAEKPSRNQSEKRCAPGIVPLVFSGLGIAADKAKARDGDPTEGAMCPGMWRSTSEGGRSRDGKRVADQTPRRPC